MPPIAPGATLEEWLLSDGAPFVADGPGSS